MISKNYRLFWVVISLFFLCSCGNDDAPTNSNDTINYVFQDGFETVNNQLDLLFPEDGSRWSNLQQVSPTNAVNEITLDNTVVIEGNSSLRILANASDAELSKADIEKNGLQIESGDTITIEASFYISGTSSLQNLLLLDLECCSCWDPTVGDNLGAENQCPGVRLILSGEEEYLSIERGKIAGATIAQSSVPFPRNEWVNVRWEMTLSDTENGINKLFINDSQVINEFGMNMPNAQLFQEVFAQEGIDFTLQEPVIYERVQVGATANPDAPTVELYVDDFSLQVE